MIGGTFPRNIRGHAARSCTVLEDDVSFEKSSDFCISSRGCNFFENHISKYTLEFAPKVGALGGGA